MDDPLQDVGEIITGGSGGDGCFRRLAGHRQDRTLYRLDHPFVSHGCRLAQCCGELNRVKGSHPLKGAGKPPKDLRQNDPRVPASPHEGPVGYLLSDDTDFLLWRFLDLLIGRLHGQQHVGSCVTVRHGIDVQRVDRSLVALQPGQTGADQALQSPSIAESDGLIRIPAQRDYLLFVGSVWIVGQCSCLLASSSRCPAPTAHGITLR